MHIIEFLRNYAFLAPYGTSIGVVIAVVQLWRSYNQSVVSFEDSLSKEYREIIRKIPYKALVGDDLNEEEREVTFNEIFNYMDLCNEQIFLRQSGRIGRRTWKNWRDGMKTNFSLKIFQTAYSEVMSKLPNNFQELKRVHESAYKCDPKWWWINV